MPLVLVGLVCVGGWGGSCSSQAESSQRGILAEDDLQLGAVQLAFV